MKRCIWCRTLNNSSAVEHIIPEALGCPNEFVFDDGTVCKKCNNKLGHVDSAVVDEYDVVLFNTGVPRKNGRKPVVRSRGNFVGGYNKKGEKFMVLNMEKRPVEGPDGLVVAAFKNEDRNIRGSLHPHVQEGRISFSCEFGRPKKFRRGIVKIAYSSIAYFLGSSAILAPEYDGIRRFVIDGVGERPIFLMLTNDPSFRNQVWPPYVRNGNYSVTFRLGPIEYLIDMSPDLVFFEEFRQRQMELSPEKQWSYLPIDSHPGTG